MIWFGRLDCTVLKLGGFYVRFAISENAGISQEKGPFVHQPTPFIKFLFIGAPNFIQKVGWSFLEDFMSVLPFQKMRESRKKKGLLSSYWNIENNGSSLKLLPPPTTTRPENMLGEEGKIC